MAPIRLHHHVFPHPILQFYCGSFLSRLALCLHDTSDRPGLWYRVGHIFLIFIREETGDALLWSSLRWKGPACVRERGVGTNWFFSCSHALVNLICSATNLLHMSPWLLASSAVQTLCKPPVTVRYWTVITCSSSRCCVLFPCIRNLLVTIGVSSPTTQYSLSLFPPIICHLPPPLPARAVEAQNLKFSSSCSSSSSPPEFCISLSLQLSSDNCLARDLP